MRPSKPIPAALYRTKSSLELLVTGLRWLVMALVSGVCRLGARAVAVVRGPVSRLVRGPVATFLFGRRAAVSVVLVGLAAVIAALTAWVVAATTGYPTLERWVVGTWTGTDPHAAVFVGGAFLVGLAAASAAANAGLLPTLLLPAGSLFGAGVTRYGTVVTAHAGDRAVSLPDALAFALGVAAVGGVLVGVAGYGLGALGRRGAQLVRADPPVPVDR
ncbi:MAG: hypothetical protein ABEH58_02640 [Haloplanus sp.]